jgi:hypothetical protein
MDEDAFSWFGRPHTTARAVARKGTAVFCDFFLVLDGDMINDI